MSYATMQDVLFALDLDFQVAESAQATTTVQVALRSQAQSSLRDESRRAAQAGHLVHVN